MKIFLSAFVITCFLGFSAYPQPQDSIFVIISGDTVHIWNTGAFENCASLFRMDVSISNDTIYVTEVDTAEDYVYCMCYFDLYVSITGLQSGNYEVLVYREFPLLYPGISFYIGSTSFTYGGSPLTYLSKTYQSDCYNITKEKGHNIQPEEFTLYDNFPNPFNPTTTIKYQIPELSFVTIKVYDVLGNEIATLVNEKKSTGTYEVEFSSHSGSVRNLPSGVYLYKLQAGDFVQIKKMILMK